MSRVFGVVEARERGCEVQRVASAGDGLQVELTRVEKLNGHDKVHGRREGEEWNPAKRMEGHDLVECPVRLVSRLSTPGFDVGADGQDGGGKGLQQQARIHKFNVAEVASSLVLRARTGPPSPRTADPHGHHWPSTRQSLPVEPDASLVALCLSLSLFWSPFYPKFMTIRARPSTASCCQPRAARAS